MSHLSPAETIDLLDGTLEASRQAHVRECGRCRDAAARARVALDEARSDEAPEPSPLFWEHFAARVQQAVRSAPAPPRWSLPVWRPVRALAATVAVLVAVGSVWYVRDSATVHDPVPGQTVVRPLESAAVEDDDLLVDANGDGSWDLVARGAESLEWDDVMSAGFTVRPGAAERALLELSDEQQAELARLLEAEIGRLPS